MKIALGFAFIASAMVWIVGADVFGDRKSGTYTLKTSGHRVTVCCGDVLAQPYESFSLWSSEIRTLKTVGVTAYTSKALFETDLGNIATLPLWRVDFQYFNALPLPNFRIASPSFLIKDNSTMPLDRFSIKEAIKTAGIGSLGTGNLNKLVAQVPGPQIVASLEIDNFAVLSPTGKIDITMSSPMIGWGAQFKGIQETIRFTLTYGGLPISPDFAYTVDPNDNGVDPFIGTNCCVNPCGGYSFSHHSII
jgi:hypothetical protein